MDWNPGGRRKRGRPALTWRRTVEKDLEERGTQWRDTKRLAQDRSRCCGGSREGSGGSIERLN